MFEGRKLLGIVRRDCLTIPPAMLRGGALARRSREARRSQVKPGAAVEGKMMMMMSSH